MKILVLASIFCTALLAYSTAQRPNRRRLSPGSQSAVLSILSDPKSVTWNVRSSNPQQLQCGVSGPPSTTVRWEKDGRTVSENSRISIRKTPMPPNRKIFSILQIAGVQKLDEGSYVCVAEYRKLTVKSNPALLTIYGPPSVNHNVSLPKSISVAWHDSFSLQCKGKGPPAISKVIWNYEAFSKDGRSVLDGTQNKRLQDTNLKALPREDDAMSKNVIKYEVYCMVYNAEGSQRSKTTTINIKQRPGKPLITKVVPHNLGRVVELYWRIGFDGHDEISSCIASIGNSNGNDFARTSTLGKPSNSGENTKILANLEPVTTYWVRVNCKNSIGISPWSEKQQFKTTEGLPDQAPRNVIVNVVNSTTLNATWLPIPEDRIFGILRGYEAKLLRNGQLEKRKTLLPDTTSVYFSGRIPGEEYCVSVLGSTNAGKGEQSMPKCIFLPKSEPIHPPLIKSIEISPGKVTFMYTDGDNKKGALRNCSIVMQDVENHEYRVPITVSKSIEQNVMRNLLPNTRYEAVIQCYSVAREPVTSEKQVFRTAEEKPRDAPTGLHLENKEKAMVAFWDHIDVSTLNGNFTGYNVCITATSSKMTCFWSENANFTFFDVVPLQTYSVSVAACTNAGCGPLGYAVGTASNWNTPSTASPSKEDTTIFQSVAVTVAGHFNFVYVAIAVLAVAVIIVAIALFCRNRRRKKRDESNGVTVAYTPSNGGAQYDQVSTGLQASPTNTNTLNSYDTPSLSNRPLLSAETLEKLKGVKFSRERLILGERLGKGEFGRVYKAKFRTLKPTGKEDDDGNIEVAVKTMIMDEYDSSEREEFVKEGLRMKGMDHPNVMRLIGICLPEENNSAGASGDCRMSGYEAISPLVVVPYMANGDLKHYLYTARVSNETKHLTLNKLIRFACDIANGMEYVASRNIVHRDLACRNCMLDANMHVVVSDFGLSRKIYSTSYYTQKRAAKMPVKWMALESLLDRIYTSSTDVWAFGVTVWEIFTFCLNPYPGVQNHEMHELLKAGTRLKHPKNCPKDIWNDAIYPCWDPRPEERPTFPELVDMFTSYLKAYPVDYDREPSTGNPVYVNVRPPEEYETLVTPSDPLLHSNTISRENNEVPLPYDEAVERLPSGKLVQKRARDRSSSKQPLLHHKRDDHTSDEDDNVVDL